MKRCKKCLYDEGMDPSLKNHDECKYCKTHSKLEKQNPIGEKYLSRVMNEMRNSKGKYDCLYGISGGCDSSYLLHLLDEYDINPLVFHWDNGWDRDIAKRNMEILNNHIDFDFINIKASDEYHRINKAFLEASVSDADIPNDIAMMRLSFDLAKKFNIKYVVNGHNFRTESSCPVAWTFMDSKYIENVYREFTGEEINDFPLFPYPYQFKNAFSRLKYIRPLYHVGKTKEEMKEILKDEYGWIDYGKHHGENVYTAFVGYYLLPKKFGIDKRKLSLSAKIRSSRMTKAKAMDILKEPPSFSSDMLNEVIHRYFDGDDMQLKRVMEKVRKQFFDYVQPNKFITLKPLFWLATKIGFFPYTFYKKYTTEVKELMKNG